MLATRLVTGFILAGTTVAVLYLDEWRAPWFPLWLIVSIVVSTLAAKELVGLLQATSAQPSGTALVGGVITVVLANWAPHLSAHAFRSARLAGTELEEPLAPVHALAWPLMAYVGVVMLTFVLQSLQFQRPGKTMATIAGTLLGVTYIGVLASFVIQMRWFEGPYHGLLPLAYLIMAAKGADTGAYTLGRIAGRHKLWPRLSPNKTIEGALGGLLFSMLGTLAVAGIASGLLQAPTPSWPSLLVFGLVVGTAAQLGDLMESMIKRDCERKDASDTVPGFGGVLDVIDSLLFAGPVGFGCWLVMGA